MSSNLYRHDFYDMVGRTEIQEQIHSRLHAFLDELALSTSLTVRELSLCDVSMSSLGFQDTNEEEGSASPSPSEQPIVSFPKTLNFFRLKGRHLHTLKVDHHPLYRGLEHLLEAVVESCSELRHLTVTQLPVRVGHLRIRVGWTRPVLRRLQSLAFHANPVNPQDVLPGLLADAVHIESIDFRCVTLLCPFT